MELIIVFYSGLTVDDAASLCLVNIPAAKGENDEMKRIVSCVMKIICFGNRAIAMCRDTVATDKLLQLV